MASVDKMVSGEKLEKFIAGIGPVQAEIDRQARKLYAKAEANLARVRSNPKYTGDFNAELEIESYKDDRYVVLHDPLDGSSPGAAASIEYGHHAGPMSLGDSRPWVEGKWIMHDAAGIERRAR